MAYVSPFEDAPAADTAQLREASGANDNVLARSLRGGFYGAGSQLLSTGAAVADAVGADNVGAGLHTRSKGLRDTAALPGNAPRVGSYSQLRDDFSMDNLGEYVGGLVGGSLPVTAAGIAGGMATGGAGFVPAMLGAGAATMPFNVGEVVQRQQSDPQALQQGAGQRLGEAVLGGAGASAVESLVPGLVGRQILGKGVGNLAKESFKQMAGRNAMDIPLEGLTEGTGTAIKQFAANQDKALDWNEIKEGAIGGAAAGSVFTGVGTAADALHSVAPKTGEMLGDARTSINERLAKLKGAAGEKVEAAAATAPGKKVKSAYDEVADLVERGKQKFDDTLDKVMKGEELGSPADWLKATTDEAKKYMTDLSDSEKVKAVTKAAKEMMDDVGLDAAKRADLADAMKNTGDRASQVTIATMKKAWDLSKKAGGMLSDLADAVSEGYDAHKRRDVDVDAFTVDEGEAGSGFTPAGLLGKPGAAADVTDVTPKGEPAKMTLKEFAAARKAFIAKAMSEGKTEDEARGLFNTSQNEDRVGAPPPPEVPKMSEDYSGVHAVIADAIKKNGIVERRPELFDSDKKVNIMADTMRKLIEQMSKGPVKLSVMKKTMRLLGDDAVGVLSSLKDAMKYDADPTQTEQFFQNINTMMDVEKGEKTLHEVMNASMVDQNKTHHTAQDADVLIAHARGKMDGSRFRSPGEAAVSDRLVNEFYERTYGENADAVRAAVEKAAGMEGRKRAEGGDRLDENGVEVESSEGGFDEAGNRLTAGSTDRQVYGVSKPNAAGQQSKQLNGLAMHKDSAQVQRIIDDLRKPTTGRKRSGTEKANEYAAVDSNGDYVYDIRFEQLPGSEFGHVVIEKYDNTKEFNETDLASIAHNTHDYPDSPSRLNVGGHALDATKIVNVARKKMQDSFESDTPKSAIQRMRESFSYGISMLTDQFGERINVPDAAVIGFINGEPVTWGKARKHDGRSAMDKERDAVTQDIVKARAAWAKAKEDGAPEEVLAELKATYQELVRLEAGVLNDELGRGEDYQGRSHKRQRPLTVVETRDAVERGENPWSPMRSREDVLDSGNVGVGSYDAATRAAMEAKGGKPGIPSERAEPRSVYPAARIELDPEDGTGKTFRVIKPGNLNGETRDDTGATITDKDGNIHALKDYSGPVFGGNDKNRVTRKPWGTVDRQDDPQPTLDGKRVRNKQTDLAPKEENIHRSNMDGSGHYVGADKMKRGNLIDAIDSWDGTVSAGAASVKAKAESLLANFDKMSRADRVRFTSIAPNDVKATRGLPAVKMEPMGLADARTIVNELAAKYKDVIVAPGEEAQSVPTKQVTTHQRNPVQFYNDGKAGVRGPEKAAGAAPAKAVTGVTLTGGQFVGKDNVKSKQATKFIGRGSANSSTASYARQWGDRANTGQYTAEDRVFISAEGKRTGRVDPDAAEIGKAMAAGATILTDSMTTGRERDHNVGERQVAEILSKGGYAESAPGVWGPSKNSAAKPSINEKLVDKVVLSENYPTTVKGAEKFLNAAKKRLAALEAEDHRVLNDDDHPTNRLPEEEQKVLDALRQTFDKNSDLAPFFTELDGWGAVPEVEQIRLMEFAESLTGGKPSPKPQAPARGAARFGDDGVLDALQTRVQDKMFEHPTAMQQAEMSRHIESMDAGLANTFADVHLFREEGKHRGMAYPKDNAIGINYEALGIDGAWPNGMTRGDRLKWVLAHEGAHMVDRDADYAHTQAWSPDGAMFKEAVALAAKHPDIDWMAEYPQRKGVNPGQEMFAQVVALSQVRPELFNEHFSAETRRAIREGLQGEPSVREGARSSSEDLRRVHGGSREANNGDAGGSGGALGSAETKARQKAFLARAAAGDPQLHADIKEMNDAAGIRRAIELLNDRYLKDAGTDTRATLNVLDVYDTLDTRMAELVGGSEDVAYGLQTRKYSLMSTSIHDDLGRGGFAAAHDSPIKHEGTFDWRSHIGKGEGNAAFGAGTYLSTADGVHRSYKDQFTAKLNRHIRDSAAMLELREQLQEARDDANHYLEILQDGIKFGVTVIKMGSYETREEAQAALDAEIDSTKAKIAEYRKMLLPENEGKYNADGVNRNIDYLQNEKLPRLRTEKITDYEAELKAAEAREDAIGRKLDEERAKLEVHKSPTYHVSVDIKKEQLLNWDKPAPNELLGDPTVRDALDAHYHVKGNHYSEDKVTGGDVYRALTMQLGYSKGIKGKAAQAAASEYLQSIGILGHQYNAAGGRNEMHPNYVIYDDSKITTNYVHFDKSATNPNKGAGPRRRLSVEQHIEKVLGKSVRVAWQSFTHAGQYTHAFGKGLIELSVHALNPMSTAYHESLHAFFAQLRDAGATDITHVLNKAASSEHVIAQLKERFKGQPAVLAQLKDPEERAAYMYQMWASDPTFKVSIAAKNVFQKIAALIRKTLGIWSNDERALHIMEYFNSGEYAKAMGTPNAVRRALMDSHRSQILETAESFAKPLGDLADAIVGTGGARLRDTGIPALQTLADIIRRDHTTEGGDQGFIPASRMAGTKMRNDLGERLEGYTKEMLADAMQALQSNTPAVSAEGRLAARVIKDFLKDAHRYMRQAGVDIGDLGPDYFPRVWDTHYISKNQQAFRNMLEPYIRSGQMKGTADQLIHNLLARGGAEFGIESRESTQPGMQHRKERLLNFITPQDAAQFVNKDLMGTLSNYINQATRKAEWTRRLGGGHLEELIEQAMTQGATKQQLALAEDYMKGVDGTLGDDINPTARRLMGDMIVYQNVRLLSTAAFSMLIDPLGVMVRGGTVADSWNTFKRGIAGIKDTFKKDGMGATDQAAKWAELVGVVDDAMMAGVMADVYTQGMVDGTARKINNAFFKYNLVEGLNRNFRIGASEAAMKFLAHHIGGLDGKGPSPHSTRWMKELGLQKGDIQLVNGRIALTQQEGLQAAQVGRVHLAINQWVDGAVLRPDASTKPIWMNDPHYALFAHLKQFVFSFQETILKRVFHEVKSGNYTPMMVLASYVPAMMAADMAKGALVNAGDTPEWQKGWGAGDYLGYAVERAGLYGVGQFGVDAVQDLHRGGSGIGALTGPTIEQLTDIMNTLGGHRQFGTTLIDAMPANNVLKGWSGGPEQVQTE